MKYITYFLIPISLLFTSTLLAQNPISLIDQPPTEYEFLQPKEYLPIIDQPTTIPDDNDPPIGNSVPSISIEYLGDLSKCQQVEQTAPTSWRVSLNGLTLSTGKIKIIAISEKTRITHTIKELDISQLSGTKNDWEFQWNGTSLNGTPLSKKMLWSVSAEVIDGSSESQEPKLSTIWKISRTKTGLVRLH
jgi:hypothetical protein